MLSTAIKTDITTSTFLRVTYLSDITKLTCIIYHTRPQQTELSDIISFHYFDNTRPGTSRSLPSFSHRVFSK